MKKLNKILTVVLLGLTVSSCSQLQGTLSSKMQSDLEQETGKASISVKAWFYNGSSQDDMSLYCTKLSDNYFDQSLLIDFGKRVTLTSLSGSIELHYRDEDGFECTKTITSLSGTFVNSNTSFALDMSDVMKLFNTQDIPTGTAYINLKCSGFKCDEGPQKGRSIGNLEVDNIQIKPLYETKSVDFSTIGYTEDSFIEFDTNSSLSLEAENYIVTGKCTNGNTYLFAVTSDNKTILIKPQNVDVSSLDGESVTLYLTGIKPVTCGHSYDTDLTVNFSKYAVIIDGKKDSNFASGKNAIVAIDSESDQDAFASYNYASIQSLCDIHEVSVTSDDEYLYIGVSGDIVVTWNDALVIQISNGSVTGGSGAKVEGFASCDTESYAAGQGSRAAVRPNVYIVHQPGLNNTGTGSLRASAYVQRENTDISSLIKYSPEGWRDDQSISFVEYAIPLGSDTGLSKGDSVKIIAGASLQWSDGKALVDVCPDTGVQYGDTNHTNVKYNFSNALEYLIK